MRIYGPHGEVLLSGYVEKLPKNQNYRFKDGKGIQLFNPDTGKWHTLVSVGDPAQLMQDDGEDE